MSRRLPLVLIVLLGAILRWSTISSQSIWLDEATSLHIASLSIGDILAGVGFDRHTPPFYYIALHPWIRIFSSSAESLRGFSLLFDIGSIVLLWHIASRLFGYRAAIFASSLAAASPFAVYYAQEGRMYTLLLFLVLATLYIVVNARHRSFSKSELLLLLLIGILGMYTHYYYALFYMALSATIVFDSGLRSTRGKQWVLLSLAVGISFIPWVHVVLTLLGSGGQTFREHSNLVLPYTFLRYVVGYGIMPLSYGTKDDPLGTLISHLPIVLGPLFLFGFCAVFGLYRIILQERKNSLYILLPLFVPGILAALVSIKVPMLSERYLIVSYPFFILLVTYGLLQLRSSDMGLALCLFAFFFGVLQQATNPLFGNNDWRAVSRFIALHNTKAPIVVTPHFATDCIRRNFTVFTPNIVELDFEIAKDPKSSLAHIRRLDTFWLIERSDVAYKYEALVGKKEYVADEELFLPKGNGLRVSLLKRAQEKSDVSATEADTALVDASEGQSIDDNNLQSQDSETPGEQQ